ncbi:MAG: DUF3604 domain-containing protein [Candidatus Binatia bacterium]|nr:DUF3604 domain-containing protein [Candidatus Binatia bacterium]MDG2011418.1 DUF3604 domain-containing protein [Candidatus Binatia bacterium]
MKKRILWIFLLLVTTLGGLGYLLGHGAFGEHEGPGEVTPIARDPHEMEMILAERRETESRLSPAGTQILFGDLHVHTTFSSDAFVMSLPLVSGEGAHPPADACDFARHCAALDFWSINDHAESLTPAHWRETVESIRACNAVADPENPDVIAFLGWEWTQDGTSPENHWGHKNIILRDIEEENIPTRPIAARQPMGDIVTIPPAIRAGLVLLLRDRRTLDFTTFLEESASVPPCPEGVPVRQLPIDCRESTLTPAELFAKLDDWNLPAMVIPHGTTWGNTAPPGSVWDPQVTGPNADPERQFLMEVYSGHGNSEEYRDWGRKPAMPGSAPICPPPTPGPNGFLPNCWRAGEIIEERCLAGGEPAAECRRRAAEARRNHAAVGRAGFRTVPGATVLDWQDAGQCRDCFLPAFDYRPGMSAQYMLARQSPQGGPSRARYGLIASSDNHTARPGTGYKERDRSEMSESKGPAEGAPDLIGTQQEPKPESVPLNLEDTIAFGERDVERMSSFFTTGGLVAVHAAKRDRASIWNALQSRQVYGTSGPRILLHFDLLNGPGERREQPMGSEAILQENPRFRVSAAGGRTQKPGCSDTAKIALGTKRLNDLCRNECYHPTDQRHTISRIEVVRIRPQIDPNEPIGNLIEDPWKVLPCPESTDGCQVEFTDAGYHASKRDAVYYVRAIQEPTLAVNGDNLRCKRDESGRCLELQPCYGNDAQTPYQEDCLAEIEERAWSSPIWIDQEPLVGSEPAGL